MLSQRCKHMAEIKRIPLLRQAQLTKYKQQKRGYRNKRGSDDEQRFWYRQS
jgi:hypothetical protein